MNIIKRNKIIEFVILLVSVLTLPSVVNAESVWCDGTDSLNNHQLDYAPMLVAAKASGVTNNKESILTFVSEKFTDAQLEVPLPITQEESIFVDNFKKLFINNNIGPADFKFFYQEDKDRAIFAAMGAPLLIYDCTLSPAKQLDNSQTLTNIALASYAVFKLGEADLTANIDVPVESIQELSLSYQNWLLDEGLKQWPWEMLVNGSLNKKKLFNESAPRSQIVLMRPSVGLDFQWESQETAGADVSIGVEPIGMVWYRGDDKTRYDKWFGVSALVTLGTNDNGAGIGGLIRYNNYWLGVVDRKNEDGLAVFIGLDLLKYLKSDDAISNDIQRRIDEINTNNGP